MTIRTPVFALMAAYGAAVACLGLTTRGARGCAGNGAQARRRGLRHSELSLRLGRNAAGTAAAFHDARQAAPRRARPGRQCGSDPARHRRVGPQFSRRPICRSALRQGPTARQPIATTSFCPTASATAHPASRAMVCTPAFPSTTTRTWWSLSTRSRRKDCKWIICGS